jgi:hypothetical protein
MGVSWASAAIGRTLITKPAEVEVKFYAFTCPAAGQRPQPVDSQIANILIFIPVESHTKAA